MSFEQILYQADNRVAWVTLNRPARLNAWTNVMECEVRSAMQKAERDAPRCMACMGETMM